VLKRHFLLEIFRKGRNVKRTSLLIRAVVKKFVVQALSERERERERESERERERES
jgi:hypothetical protein